MTTTTTRGSALDALFTEKQAAGVLNVQPGTLRTWRSKGTPGQPRFVKINGRSIRYRSSDLAEYMRGLTVGGAR